MVDWYKQTFGPIAKGFFEIQTDTSKGVTSVTCQLIAVKIRVTCSCRAERSPLLITQTHHLGFVVLVATSSTARHCRLLSWFYNYFAIMTSLFGFQSRRPLTSRTVPNSPGKTRVVSGSKRLRSPERGVHAQPIMKRARLVPVAARDLQKERKAEREQREAEFRDKYTRAFPTWKFYFDTEKPLSVSQSSLKMRVVQLGAVSHCIIIDFCNSSWYIRSLQEIVDFFDTTVTHVISDAELPRQFNSAENDKENNPCKKPISKKGIADCLSNRYCNA